MDFSEIEIPSNRKFGFFMAIVFLALSTILYNLLSHTLSLFLFILSGISLFIALTKPEWLFGLNKAWMRFGFLLGAIVSPIVLGVIFYGLITPTSLITRMFGRDELRLRASKSQDYWIKRSDQAQSFDFKNQF